MPTRPLPGRRPEEQSAISYTARSGPGQGVSTVRLRLFGRALRSSGGRSRRTGYAPATSFDQLDPDDAADRSDRGEGRGQQGVGGILADAGEPDHRAEAAEADPVGPAEDHRLGFEARGDPEEEQAEEDHHLE